MAAVRYFDLVREMRDAYNHRLRLVESAKQRAASPPHDSSPYHRILQQRPREELSCLRKQREFFEVSVAADREVPKVSFGSPTA